MYLKSLELSGFKSFVKKTVLEFNSPITAVVGPNGSGKSNIAEAFRFVLGEQSIKSMRGKRTEDLIWNGGGDAARANRASVKVVFDNRKRILNVDFDEVSIERVIYRDSSSEYSINGTLVRLKDVIELLAAAHIGSSGHHIISQGEADKILNAGSKERRDMLEDALGLKVYQYKREESERKLEKTEENMASVESLRREIAPHLKFLKKQVEKIEKTFALKEELRNLCKEYFRREDVFIKDSKRVLESERQVPTAELARLHHELAQAKEALSKSASRDAKSADIIRLEEKLAEVRGEKDALTRDLGRIEGAILSEGRIVRREQELLAREEGRTLPLKEAEIVVRTIDEKIGEAQKSSDSSVLRVCLDFVRTALSEFIARHKSQNSSLSREQSETEIARLKQERQAPEARLKTLHTEEEHLRRTYATLQKDIEKEKDTSRDAEKAVFRIMSEENAIRGTLAALSAREEKIMLLEADFKRSLHEASTLLGRDVLDFDMFAVLGETGTTVSEAEIVAEDRVRQEERKRVIEKIKIRIEDAGAGGGDEVLKEYKEVGERDAFLERELADLVQSAASLKNLIVELKNTLDVEFREGVGKINAHFEQFFTLMFGGGQAGLRVIREVKKKKSDTDLEMPSEDGEMSEESGDEEISEGIEIEVSLPRKKIKGLMMLSGGERALTSIALLFAISQVNPPPFVILDETDAALDEANSRKYGDMIVSLSKLSQLILISHNRETMSRAGILYGVTMGSGGGSKLLSIAFEEAVAVAK